MKNLFNIIILLSFAQLGYSQCFPDRHNSTAYNGWISCAKTMNPDNSFGETHWIQYDFGQSYSLHNISIWNTTHSKYIKDGIKNAVFSYSNNGSTWTTIDTFTIPRGVTSSFYEGNLICDLNGLSARYILITALDNHGGDCVGFSEIKFRTGPDTVTDLVLNLMPCENGGAYKNISGLLNFGGVYSGIGVTDNGDETFDFDADEVGAGVYTISYTYNNIVLTDEINVLQCGHVLCPDCNECGNYDINSIVNLPNIPSETYYDEELESIGEVWNSSDVTFRGKNEVNLLEGFEVQESSIFLAEIRECYDNLVVNGNFENAFTNWSMWNGDQAEVTMNVIDDPVYEGMGALEINVIDSSQFNWMSQLRYEGIALNANKTYKFSFAAKSDIVPQILFTIRLNVQPYTHFFQKDVILSEYWNTYEYTFESQITTTDDVRLSFLLAEYEGMIHLDQIKLIELD